MGKKPLHAFENQRAIGTAEAEGVTQGVLHTANLTRFVRHEVQIATFIRVIQVDGWWNRLIAQRKDRVD
jgi:hypothetical protein